MLILLEMTEQHSSWGIGMEMLAGVTLSTVTLVPMCHPARRNRDRTDSLHLRKHLAGSRQAPEVNSPALEKHSLL